jgi:hypothetical protein
MGFRCGEDPFQNVIKGAVVLLSGGGVERAPDVSLMCWWLDFEVVKPV